ncbi:short-chain alcohol dehydrogenase [Paramarasmius palmivorus]|uniref:Short-chain alcohol dehydrogenase n=1 Tax=Paramarasmius palmivorus TaxID=297713 RepID=A0AAW0CEM7_9AGAR
MGIIWSFITQCFPPEPLFGVEDIPDQTGKVVVITGGNTGVGFETAKALLPKNARVYIACRSKEKAENAIVRLREATGREAIFMQLDLASLSSIEDAAELFLSQEKELHILFNNAGVMEPDANLLTADGYDLTVGTNVLGHYYFTKLLLPALLAVSQNGPHKARVVTTASIASQVPSSANYEAFRDGPLRKRLGVQILYAQSKFLNVVFATELARRYGDKGIVSTSLNPGNIATDLQRTWTGAKRWLLSKLLYSAPMGALTGLYAATAKDADEFNGAYFGPWARRFPPNPSTQKPEEGERLWGWLEEQVKKHS